MTIRYEERHWVPAWIVACAFLLPFLAVFGASLALSAGGSDGALSPLLGAVYGAAFGVLFGGLIWANHARRIIRVTDTALQIGSREPILLREIAGARTVEGGELRSLRGRLTSLDGAELGIAAAAASPAPAEVAVGAALVGTRHRRAGMVSPPWMRSAALVATTSGSTRTWLIGSRDASELVAAIEAGRGSGRGDERPAE